MGLASRCCHLEALVQPGKPWSFVWVPSFVGESREFIWCGACWLGSPEGCTTAQDRSRKPGNGFGQQMLSFGSFGAAWKTVELRLGAFLRGRKPRIHMVWRLLAREPGGLHHSTRPLQKAGQWVWPADPVIWKLWCSLENRGASSGCLPSWEKAANSYGVALVG